MKKLILIFILSLLPSLALAQTSRNPCFINATGGCTPVSTTNPLPVDASVSASITGFEPAATGTPITVTTGGDTGTLPAGDVVAVFNVGTTNTAYCKLGASSTTSDIAIPPASWFAFTVGAATQLTCITSTSTTTVNMVGGTGLPTGAGGGGGGSGGGGAVTMALGAVASGAYSSGSIASGAVASGAFAAGALAAGAGVDGWDLTQGAIADAAATAGSTGTISAKLRLMTTQLDNINTSVNGSIPAGSAIIGKVGIDQTTPGTTNAVSATNFPATVSTGTGAQGASSPRVTVATDSATVAGSATLPAGTNTIGKVGQNPSVGGATPTFKSLSMNTATTTEIIPLSGSTVTYVTSLRVMAGGTANVTFKYGTGTNCGTGTTTLSGPWPLAAQAGFATGAGTGAIMIVPAGQALCVTSDAAVQVTTAATYQQI